MENLKIKNSLTKEQAEIVLPLLREHREKLKWVMENRERDNKEKRKLKNKIQKLTEIIIVLGEIIIVLEKESLEAS